MHHHNSKRKQLIKLVTVYSVMTAVTLVVAILIVSLVLGIQFDSADNKIEQYALIQVNSSPTGAQVAVDGHQISGSTPNKTSVPEGNHEVVVWREGYETWRKTLFVKSGTLTWLNYILMVPKKLSVEPLLDYDSVSSSLASENGKYMITQQYADKPVFDLSDISSDQVTSTQLTIPKKDYSEAYTSSVTHNFKLVEWDEGERYFLVSHNYNDEVEWLVVDSQDENNTFNVTKMFSLDFGNIKFSGTGGNILFAIESGNLRKLDLNAKTISKILLSKIQKFNLYDQNIITYVGDGETVGSRIVGLYRDGDVTPYIIRAVAATDTYAISVVSSRYFNEDYVAISDGKKIDILKGNYHNSIINNATNLKIIKSITANNDVEDLSFSPSGQYLLAQSGANFTSYDLEYKKTVLSTVSDDGFASSLKWLNNSYFWSDNNSSLNIREFDGCNPRSINSVVVGQSAVMTRNFKYIYSIGKKTTGYQLQRVNLILP